ncbi:MAG: hypothetical protein AAFZ14_09075 [Pseudomonadota bacterium]
MSDPMTNAEVEDVLSSIRRLVSDDKPAEPEPEAPAAPDRLVLTPALRVTDEEAVAEDAAEEADALPDTDPYALTDFIIENHDAPSEDVAEPEAVEAAPEVREDLWVNPETLSSFVRHGQGLREKTDVDEAADEGRAEEDSEAAWPPSDVEDDAHHVAGVEEDDTDDLVTDAAPETDTVTADAHSPDRTAQTLSEKIATLETLVASRTDEWEPDDPGADAYAGTEAPTLAWEDAETAATPTFSHHAKPAEDAHDAEAEDILEDDDAQVFSSDEDVLDEDALRDLVADIVREELQGALGERITRNVRKLVRREIHRALAAQELE